MNERTPSFKYLEQLLASELSDAGDWYKSWMNKVDDTYALGLLQPLLQGPYLPFNLFALRPYCLAFILNDIVINQRRSIIEFGSGLSTLMIGRLIRKNQLAARLVTIEHDAGWANRMQTAVANEQLEEFIQIVHAPLSVCSFAIDNNLWYDIGIIESAIAHRRFDMVIVDGPPAHEASKKEARFPAMPFIYKNLSEKYSVYLDDCNREGEQTVLRRWSLIYDRPFNIAGDRLGYQLNEDSFNPLI